MDMLSVCDSTVLSASCARLAHALCSVAATKSTTYQKREITISEELRKKEDT
jgi:hypothetical protein